MEEKIRAPRQSVRSAIRAPSAKAVTASLGLLAVTGKEQGRGGWSHDGRTGTERPERYIEVAQVSEGPGRRRRASVGE